MSTLHDALMDWIDKNWGIVAIFEDAAATALPEVREQFLAHAEQILKETQPIWDILCHHPPHRDPKWWCQDCEAIGEAFNIWRSNPLKQWTGCGRCHSPRLVRCGHMPWESP